MNVRLFAALAVLVPFTAYSVLVAADHGPLGFIELAMREAWATQMLLDLLIALGLFAVFAYPDARARGLPFWPYVVGCALLGSPAALAYVVHRELAARRPVVAGA
ncbi:MAG: DUF2834 domain-containing protein [Myxococcota bacterium]|nr:DUF2834 domain-containing protein [Myxococcota bacterium]